MWKRKSFYECASELRGISDQFRALYLNKFDWSKKRRRDAMVSTSERGLEVLRVLALAIRSEQDYGLTSNSDLSVGALKRTVARGEVQELIQEYNPPFDDLEDFEPLELRQALNKVAHADPRRSGFYADVENHDLILSGANRSREWVAILSVPELCNVVKSLPDVQITDE